MVGYRSIERAESACIRFVRNADMTGSEQQIFDEARGHGIRVAYIEAGAGRMTQGMLANLVATELRLEYAPYDERHSLFLSDDLITLAYQVPGLVVVIDNAWALLESNRDELFNFLETFQSPLHHWLKQGKPYHLCLQMEPNEDLARFVKHL